MDACGYTFELKYSKQDIDIDLKHIEEEEETEEEKEKLPRSPSRLAVSNLNHTTFFLKKSLNLQRERATCVASHPSVAPPMGRTLLETDFVVVKVKT